MRKLLLRRRQPLGQQGLALFGAFPAVGLSLAEQLDELLIPAPLGVVDIGLQPQGVLQIRLNEPDQVVPLVPVTAPLSSLLIGYSFSVWWPPIASHFLPPNNRGSSLRFHCQFSSR